MTSIYRISKITCLILISPCKSSANYYLFISENCSQQTYIMQVEEISTDTFEFDWIGSPPEPDKTDDILCDFYAIKNYFHQYPYCFHLPPLGYGDRTYSFLSTPDLFLLFHYIKRLITHVLVGTNACHK